MTQKMQPRIVGISATPNVIHINRDRSVSRLLAAKLPTLSPSTPTLIQAGTGAGKTTAVLDIIVPYAIEHNMIVWFVSSRAAINSQFKSRLAQRLGLSTISTDYTPEGLRHLEDIGPVKVLTYHRLWTILNTIPEGANDVGILAFDEIHALAQDATFVPFTGQVLNQLPLAFGNAIRIYLSATPEPVLPALSRAEGHQSITVYKWPANYQHFRLHFWSTPQDLASHFNQLPESEHALIFVPSIAAGLSLQKKLTRKNYLVTAMMKEETPTLWAELLEHGCLDGYQILLATATLDAGVSLLDPALRHIVCCGIDPVAVVQQAGRKRVRSGEAVSLYLWNPSKKQLGNLLRQDIEALSILRTNGEYPHQFLQEFILKDTFPQARKMCTVTSNCTLEVNTLAHKYYERELEQIQRLLKYVGEHPMECFWCRQFRQQLPKNPSHWLGARKNQEAEAQLKHFLQGYLGRTLDTKAEKASFASTFRQLYSTAIGRRKNDRADRSWGLNTCSKALASLNWGFELNSIKNTWVLRNQVQGGEIDE